MIHYQKITCPKCGSNHLIKAGKASWVFIGTAAKTKSVQQRRLCNGIVIKRMNLG